MSSKQKVSLWGVAGLVGFLAVVEFTSGILQGYYTPLFTDIARNLGIHDADVNWFEAGQLMVSALVVPALAKLGDMFGHKRILLITLAITAAASLTLPFANNFWVFLSAWSMQGFYVVWLPLLVALIYSSNRKHPSVKAITRTAAGILVAVLELGAIVGALSAGFIGDALVGKLWLVLLVPGLVTTLAFFIVMFTVKESDEQTRGEFDTLGLVLVTVAILILTAGLSLIRVVGVDSLIPWLAIIIGLAMFYPFARWELKHPDPLIDVRMFISPSMWPLQLTAALFGVSVLGAQAPLSTFARTDYDSYGYGLSATPGTVSILIGAYLLSLIVGAMLFPLVTKVLKPRIALVFASLLVALGYLMFLPLHHSVVQLIINMWIAGLGSGALVAALPATAAAVAKRGQTGVATGLTNTTKTIGGAFASAIFGVALFSQVTETASGIEATAGSLNGYFTVWMICGGTALVAALALMIVPKNAFMDVADDKDAPQLTA